MIIQLPHLPRQEKKSLIQSKLIKKIANSSISYILFNFFFIHFFNLISLVFGNSLRQVAIKSGIKHVKSRYISESLLSELRDKNPDWIFNNTAFIIRANLLKVPKLGVLNYHGGPLPAFRGAANYVWLMLDKADVVHGTLHFVDEGLDTGAIIAQSDAISIKPGLSAARLYLEILQAGRRLLHNRFDDLRSGYITATPQHASGTVRSFPKRGDVAAMRRMGHRMVTFADIWTIVSMAVTGRI